MGLTIVLMWKKSLQSESFREGQSGYSKHTTPFFSRLSTLIGAGTQQKQIK